MKLHSRRDQLRQELLQGIEMRVGTKSVLDRPPGRGAPGSSTSDLPESPIRIVVITESSGLLDEISSVLLVQPDIDLAGISNYGDEALEEVEILDPQIAVVDLRMPGMSGLNTARSLRWKFPSIGIIITSNAEGSEIESICRNYGADDLISKKRLRRCLLPAIRRAWAQRAFQQAFVL